MGRTILVVDDSPLTLDAVRAGLEGAGYAVRTASDLGEVPRTLDGAGFALVLIDVEMAEAFGDDVAQLWLDDGAPPIFLLSALPEHELSRRAASAGVAGCIPKGAGVAEVVRRVNATLGETTEAPPTTGMTARFVATARRRLEHVRAQLGEGGLRQAGYELHALIGEAAILGFQELAALAQDGRHATEIDMPEACTRAVAEIEARLPGLQAAAPEPAPRRAASGRRVLIVDDSEIFAITLGALLEDAGYTVEHAATLAAARGRLGVRADAVLLDLELGGEPGAALIPEVRAAMPDALVVILTGAEILTIPDGADLALHKSLDPTSLLGKLELALKRR